MPITLISTVDAENFEALLRHRRNVQENCERIASVYIKAGDMGFARKLMANAAIHDHSKFFGLEWKVLVLRKDQDKLAEAVNKHNQRNKHHPEYWGSINKMPLLYLGELACDWKARSTEAGTCLVDWINQVAADRWGFTKKNKVYQDIMKFVNMLIDKPMTTIALEIDDEEGDKGNSGRRRVSAN
jgi:hypothetical protein